MSKEKFNALKLLALLVLAFFLVNARWIWLYRHDSVLDIDEAGYISYALVDFYGLHFGGLSGWFSAIEMPSSQAPLTMALTSLFFWITGPHIIVAFAVPLVTGTGVVLTTYALGRSIGSCRVALMAAALTATCPVIINYTRSYQFSMPLTLFTTFALVSLLQSKGFRRTGWTLAFGLSLGLMPLARTMSIAFIPGLIVAAVLVVLVDSECRLVRLAKLLSALVLGLVIAEIWFWRNGSAVFKYLLGYGYGKHALEYGHKTSTLGFSAWLSSFDALWADIYFPHVVILAIGTITLTAVFLRGVIREGIVPTAYQVMRSPLLPVTIFVFEAGLALTSSSNKGSGFFAPLIPGMMTLSAWAFCRIGKSRFTKASFSSLVAIVAIVSSLPLLDLRTPFAPNWTATLPLLGGGIITDGRGTIQKYEAQWGFGSHNSAEPLDKAESNSWISLSRTTSDLLTKEFGMHATVMFGFRNVLYNVNTVNLMHLLTFHSALAMNQVDPVMTGTTEQGYLQWLNVNGAMACALLTKDQSKRDFLPVVDPKLMDEAAVQAGFVKISDLTTPDGQHVFLWKNKKSLPQCHPNASISE